VEVPEHKKTAVVLLVVLVAVEVIIIEQVARQHSLQVQAVDLVSPVEADQHRQARIMLVVVVAQEELVRPVLTMQPLLGLVVSEKNIHNLLV
jgi:hypothetical protein